MNVTVQADAKAMRRFHSAINDLRKISGKDFEQVIKAELGAALSSAVTATQKASVKSIEKNHRAQPGARYAIEYAGPVSRTGKSYTPAQIDALKRRAARRRANAKNGKLVYYLSGSNQSHQHPSWLFSQIKDFRDKSLANKKKARGLAASMWVKIGEGLGIPVKAPGYVKNAAHHKSGDMRHLIELKSTGKGNSYEIGFINKLSHVNKWTRAGATFRQAMNRRANFFSASVKLAGAKKIKSVMARYPGLASVS
jgi:hypothetical protein